MDQMSPLQQLYYAIGQMAYAVARADGMVQAQEKKRFHDLIVGELSAHDKDFDISHIIFTIMVKDDAKMPDSYYWGMRQIRINSHYLSPALKSQFIRAMEIVAAAYPPVTIEERVLIDKFRDDIAPIHGDPVYYSKIS